MAGSNLVAADAAARVFGPWGATVVTAVSLISLLTLLNVVMMTVPRLLYVIARDAGVPGLSHVAANGSPQIALAVMAVTVALLALVGVYGVLLAFSVWLMTGTAATVNASAIVLRRREPELERPFRMPLFPLPAIFALLVNLSLLAAFLYESPLIVLQATALLAVVAGGLYFLTRRTASA
jgi:APA family basic amino acid/polyamine antiporter